MRSIIMAAKDLSARIDQLFRQCKWAEAREVLEREREKTPRSHWVLTQLGVTYYEEHRYEDSLKIFLASLKIVSDCPLTLWNLAGAFAALGDYPRALEIYDWLLRSKKSSIDDPCWEGPEWADSLKADCAYRVGVCFERMGKKKRAEQWFRQYLDLVFTGIPGSYSVADVACRIQGLQGPRAQAAARGGLRKTLKLTRPYSGKTREKRGAPAPPRFTEREFFPGRRVESKE